MPPTAKTTRPPRPQTADLPKELERLLADLIGAHEDLLRLTVEHRAAIAAADSRRLRVCIDAQTGTLGRLAELDERRRRLVAAAALPAGGEPTLSAVAERLPEPLRGRTLAAAGRLRELIAAVHREARTVRQATHSLLSHMEGLMRQIGRRLSEAGTYGRAGGVIAGPPLPCALDVRH